MIKSLLNFLTRTDPDFALKGDVSQKLLLAVSFLCFCAACQIDAYKSL